MKQERPFYLFVIGIFLILISPTILSDGMFMDGLMYSTIAHNLSSGIGSFWNLHFTSTCLTEFHEHPPLAFKLQSIFITFFGESRYFDKLYSLLTFVIVGFITLKTWKKLGLKNGWLPLLIWFSIPLVSWAASNNMLENTLTIFTSLSVLLYLKYQNENKYIFIFFAGIMLALGFLTKGFVAFFPWSFPFLLWLLNRKESFLNMILDSMWLFLATIIPLVILILLSPEAKISLQKYLDIQVLNSLKNIKTVDSRLFIINRLFSELGPAIALCVVFLIWGWRKHFPINTLKSNYNTALLFIMLGLTGVFPIMISMKQSGYYILATFPFFAIGISILIIPLIEFLFDNEFYETKGFLFFKRVSYGIFIIGLILPLYFVNNIGRDETQVKDMYTIIEKIPAGTIINILPNMWEEWGLHGYYARYKSISLDPNLDNKREYLLIQNNKISDTAIFTSYKKIELQTTDYQLYKRR
ncbi:MAG: glycosyltransferase family 39 protein [Bacteroidia bacterium]